MKKIEVRKSGIEGVGLFAKKPLTKGEIAFIAKGEITNWLVKDKKTSSTGPNWIGIKKAFWLSPKKNNALEFINHSCDPNLGIKGEVTFVAIKDIKKGKELTFDYSIAEEDLLWSLPFKCNCGSRNCRKTIKSIQSLPRTSFNKYLPYIPKYFQKVYLSYNKYV